jgi:hypothetical protein
VYWFGGRSSFVVITEVSPMSSKLHDTGGEEARRVADCVLEYLDLHPQASDTLEGISRWWMAHDKTISREVLSRALEVLVVEGHLKKRELPDGNCLWQKQNAA